MKSTSEVDPAPFQWKPQPEASRFVLEKLDAGVAACSWLREFSNRLLRETGTRLIDWVDHIAIGDAAGFGEVGFQSCGDGNVYENKTGVFPKLIMAKHLAGKVPRIGLKVERLEDFIEAHAEQIENQNVFGETHAQVRIAQLDFKGGGSICIVERHGSQSMVPGSYDLSIEPVHWPKVLTSFRDRPRDYDDPEAAFRDAVKRIMNGTAAIGKNFACDLFFRAEREYWQSRNKAARIQLARQNKLGLGWANHDHHTYRCSRVWFKPLVLTLELMGFECRERFYAGSDAGWGAQVLEQAECGIIIFADVDLSEDEISGDFAHSGLEHADEFGTVGLWCQLHGESFLSAGMHHLECQFDFDAARQQLSDEGIESMAPFTDFPHLKQAFTVGETWQVDSERLSSLRNTGVLSEEDALRFAADGVRGSHLEILERNDGYKGFNQTGISKIILQTNPTIAD